MRDPPAAAAAATGGVAAEPPGHEPTGHVALLEVLGVGSTSVVFRARINGIDCAVKCLQGAGSLAAHELCILRHLRRHAVPGIAGIAYEAVESSVVITSPVGKRLAIRAGDVRAALALHRAHILSRAGKQELRFGGLHHPQQLGPVLVNARIFNGAVNSLHRAHCCGVIHGDPRLANLAAGPLSSNDLSGSEPHAAGAQLRASVAVDDAFEIPTTAGGQFLSSQALPCCIVLDFGYGHLGTSQPTPPVGAVSERFDGRAAAYSFQYAAVGAHPGHAWVSLPYASRRQLRAYALGASHCPEPSDDLFILGASLYRLLVPWAPAADVQTPEDALLLAAYWGCLMKLEVAGGKRGCHVRPCLWGQALLCAEAYDLHGFMAAVAGAVQGTVPDWPWGS